MHVFALVLAAAMATTAPHSAMQGEHSKMAPHHAMSGSAMHGNAMHSNAMHSNAMKGNAMHGNAMHGHMPKPAATPH
jgi:pentapeptide MXKDX repeat protein